MRKTSLLASALAALLLGSGVAGFAQTPAGKAFTYQGRLSVGGGTPDPGALFDLRFRLYDAPVGGNQKGAAMETNGLAISNGLFTVVLEKLARVPVKQWNYQWEHDGQTPHVGPMAQDFKAAFFPGRDDKTISTLEFDGVALAAIQGLNQKLEQTVKEKEARIEALEKRVEKLEKHVPALTQTGGAQ